MSEDKVDDWWARLYEEELLDRAKRAKYDEEYLHQVYFEEGAYGNMSVQESLDFDKRNTFKNWHPTQRRNDQEKVNKITEALQYRERYLKEQEDTYIKNRDARMMLELERYAEVQNAEIAIRTKRKEEAQRKKNLYLLKKNFVNTLQNK